MKLLVQLFERLFFRACPRPGAGVGPFQARKSARPCGLPPCGRPLPGTSREIYVEDLPVRAGINPGLLSLPPAGRALRLGPGGPLLFVLRPTYYLLPTTLLFLLLTFSCTKEDTYSPAPPLIGFGDTLATLDFNGAELLAPVYLTRALDRPTTLNYTISGTAEAGLDYEIDDEVVLLLPAGASEGFIGLRATPQGAPDRIDRFIEITLQPTEGVRLSDRDRLRITFALTSTVDLSIWAPDVAFPQLFGYTSFGADPVPSGSGPAAGEHFASPYASRTQPNVIGLYNPVAGRSTNALNLHRIYADEEVSSGSANIRIPEFLRFTPGAEGSTFGTVEVIEQQVTITRKASSGLPPFEVGISGGGTYDENTGIILLDVYFDETAIGGGSAVLRRYSLESEDR
ncbi:MAG: hypothetical protein WBA17_03280 [Saprospiraceae bacterium]